MRHISERLEKLLAAIDLKAWREISDETTDAEFIETIRAINLRCNLADRLGEDRTKLRAHLATLFEEYHLRIESKDDVQSTVGLVLSLYDFIYKRSLSKDDRGPIDWQGDLQEYALEIRYDFIKNGVKVQPDEYVAIMQYYISRMSLLEQMTAETLRKYTNPDPLLIDDNEYAKKQVRDAKAEVKRYLDDLQQSAPADSEAQMHAITARLMVSGNPYIDSERDEVWSRMITNLIATVAPTTLPDSQLPLYIRTLHYIAHWYQLDSLTADVSAVLEDAYNNLTTRECFDSSLEKLEKLSFGEIKASTLCMA